MIADAVKLLGKILTVLERQNTKETLRFRYVDEEIFTDTSEVFEANSVSFKNQGNVTVFINALRLEPNSGMVTFGNESPSIDITKRLIKFDVNDADSEPIVANQKKSLLVVKRLIANKEFTYGAVKETNETSDI